MEYAIHILILAVLYATLSLSLDLLAGVLGLLSVAHAAFFGLGAYSSVLLTTELGLSFGLATAAGVVLAVSVSFLVSAPSLRLRDDYFVLATFAFQMVLFNLFNNWTEVTRGPLGISAIPPPEVWGFTLRSHGAFLLAAMMIACATWWVVGRFRNGPFGRLLRAIREDELFAKALGKNTLAPKVIVCGISAAIAALVGSFYAHYISYINPTSFDINQSILLLAMVMIGGLDSRLGPVIGAFVLVALPELLRFVGLPYTVAGNLRQILYGGLLVLLILWRPRGLCGHYALRA